MLAHGKMKAFIANVYGINALTCFSSLSVGSKMTYTLNGSESNVGYKDEDIG